MITADQIRAARALKNWSQSDLAARVEMSVPSIGNIEAGKHNASPATQQKIIDVFEEAGIEFIDGGVRNIPEIVKIFDGPDCYLRLLDDAYYTLRDTDDAEILFWAADERRCSGEVIEKTRALRRSDMPMRFFICEGDDYCMGALAEYRWLKKDLFVTSDVKVIYADRVAYLIRNDDDLRILLLKDAHIARDSRRIFNYIWEQSRGPERTSAETFYDVSIRESGARHAG